MKIVISSLTKPTIKFCPTVHPFKPPCAHRTHPLSDHGLTGDDAMRRWLPQLLLSVENGPLEVTEVVKIIGKTRFNLVGLVRSRNNSLHLDQDGT